MLQNPNRELKEIFREYGITRERFLKALSQVRGNQKVVSDNPEATYDTLEKYGQDLVEKARNQKLDPVIGRDKDRKSVVKYRGTSPVTMKSAILFAFCQGKRKIIRY